MPPAPFTPRPDAGKPPAAQSAKGLSTGISFQPGSNIWIQCDGDFQLDGANHTGLITKNVIIKQPGMQLLADDVHLVMKDTPPAASSLFSGDLKSLDCLGNVEVITDDEFVHCDRLFHDVDADFSRMTMDDPENDVRIYRQEESGKTQLISAVKSLEVNTPTGEYKPGGVVFMIPYRHNIPAPRAKDCSPAHRKKEPPK